jgi:Na+-translocating ferredoxin:NAD+ oxidoreductase subunit G
MKSLLYNYARPILFLTLVVFIAVSVLSLTYQATKDTIQEQEEARIKSTLQELFPSLDTYEYEDNLYSIYSENGIIGYAFQTTGHGYGGDINIMVGFEGEATLKGILIISHEETPGLGDKISEEYFTQSFAGISLDNIYLRKDGGKIDGITGATISSRAVVDAVREASREKIEIIAQRTQPGAGGEK